MKLNQILIKKTISTFWADSSHSISLLSRQVQMMVVLVAYNNIVRSLLAWWHLREMFIIFTRKHSSGFNTELIINGRRECHCSSMPMYGSSLKFLVLETESVRFCFADLARSPIRCEFRISNSASKIK